MMSDLLTKKNMRRSPVLSISHGLLSLMADTGQAKAPNCRL